MASEGTWSVGSNGSAIAWASNKSMFDVWNGGSGGEIIRIWRIWMFNGTGSTVTGVIAQVHFLRTENAPSGGTSLTANAVKYDSTNATLNANITFGTNRTITYPTQTTLLRRAVYQTDEYAIQGLALDEMMLFPVGALVFDAGYASANGVCQPLTLRNNQGLTLTNISAAAAGSVDIYCEFTQTEV